MTAPKKPRLGRPPSADPRQTWPLRLSAAERDYVERAAALTAEAPTSWARDVLVRAATERLVGR